ncbi:MAG: recombinase family protein [Lachnospiraceae bacterium]|nr:recombinase family protein [Lachnospiraceae bacterium]
MRVIIYGRVNRLKLSADSQIEKLRSFCCDRAYEVVGEIQDCCSGSVVGDNLRNLLNEPRQNYDALVILDPSRISRNLVKMLEIAEKMRSKRIELICAETPEKDLHGKRESILNIS